MLSISKTKISYDPALKHILVQKLGETVTDVPKSAAG